MFIPVFVSCLIVICRLIDTQQFLFSFNPSCLESTHNTHSRLMNFNSYNNHNIQYRPSKARHYEQCNAHDI